MVPPSRIVVLIRGELTEQGEKHQRSEKEEIRMKVKNRITERVLKVLMGAYSSACMESAGAT